MKLFDEADEYAKKNGIKFYRGFEIEYFHELDVYEKYLEDLNFLIVGQHYIVKDGELKSSFGLDSLEDIQIYSKTLVDAINTGYFNMIAHPDLCFYSIKKPTDEMYEALRPVIEACVEKDVALELNANGIRRAGLEENCHDSSCYRYPRVKFLEMTKELNAKVHISSDSHNLDAFDDWAIERAIKLANDLELNIIEDLNMDYYKK